MSIPQQSYSISRASELTGVSKNRIRDWSDKGHLPETEWIEVGKRRHRRFTAWHIEFIKTIERYRLEGYELAAAAEKAVHEISQAKEV